MRIAKENAERAKVALELLQVNVSDMPFGANAFDFIICRAAFKNLSDSMDGLKEMRRVLKPSGVALITDMRRDATDASIATEVAKLNLNGASRVFTNLALRALRRRAYTTQTFARMATEAGFTHADIVEDGIGFEASLTR